MSRTGRAAFGAIAVLALALGIAVAPAAASTVTRSEQAVSIDGESDADTIVMTGNPASITVTDTGTGGATAAGGCTQVNLTTVNCVPPPGGSPAFLFFSVSFNDGVDSFTNESVDLQGQIFAFGIRWGEDGQRRARIPVDRGRRRFRRPERRPRR